MKQESTPGAGAKEDVAAHGLGENRRSSQQQLIEKDIKRGGPEGTTSGGLCEYTATIIPIREEFRLRRLWFFHHDLRAFTSSWIPLPLFVAYRVLLAVYALVWLILVIVARKEEQGPHWLIFLSNLGYTLLTASTIAMAVLCTAYACVHYLKRETLHRYTPRKDFPLRRIYKQDNIPWYVKATWLLYNVASSSSFLIFIGFWGFLYSPCDSGSRLEAGFSNATASGSGSGADKNGSATCSDLDVYTVQIHGVNFLIVLMDLALSRVPYQFLHFFYACSFTTLYVLFSLIYWGAGGTNHRGEPFIYTTLNYGESPISFFFAALMVVAPMVTFMVLFLLAWARDLISARVGCCFSDVRRLPYRDGTSANHNGISDGEMTKV